MDDSMSDSSSQDAEPSLLSPPGSQRRAMPVRSDTANANGKRPRKDASQDEDEGRSRPSTEELKQHESGYTWTKQEDEPGYGWLSKKAIDEHNRAMDVLVHRDLAIQGRYGDPLSK